MGYYMGDFYRGSMYRGDPGFFGFLGGLAKKAVGFIPGVGPIAKTAIDMIPTGGKGVIRAVPKTGGIMTAGREILAKGGRVVAKHPVLSAAGAAGAVAGAAGVAAGRLMHHAGKRHRRMNVCNPRALRRAIRRTHGFARLAMKTIHLVHPKKHARFGGFKIKRRKK